MLARDLHQMIYLLSQKTNTFGMLSYDPNNSIEYDSLSGGFRIGELRAPLRYSIKKKSFLSNMRALHLIWSANGPTLVSKQLRLVMERFARDYIEFLPAFVSGYASEYSEYSAINLLVKETCVDMLNSEYEQMNFNPLEPRYSFRYTKLNAEFQCGSHIAICAEQEDYIVVDEEFRLACIQENLHGLIFYRSLDLTYAGRTVAKCIA